MEIKYRELLNEIAVDKLDYEKRVDIFNNYQIPVHVKYFSPILILVRILTKSDFKPGFGHSGSTMSSINDVIKRNYKEETDRWGIIISDKHIAYKYVGYGGAGNEKWIKVHKDGKIGLSYKNESLSNDYFDLETLKEKEFRYNKAIKFLNDFNFIIN